MSQAIMIAWVMVMSLVTARAWIVLRRAERALQDVCSERAIGLDEATLAHEKIVLALEMKIAAYEQALAMANEGSCED